MEQPSVLRKMYTSERYFNEILFYYITYLVCGWSYKGFTVVNYKSLEIPRITTLEPEFTIADTL